jgi:hypothetical protein
LLAKTTTQGTGFGAFVAATGNLKSGLVLKRITVTSDRLATSTSGSTPLLITNPPGTVNAQASSIYGVTLTGRSYGTDKDQITFRGRRLGDYFPLYSVLPSGAWTFAP